MNRAFLSLDDSGERVFVRATITDPDRYEAYHDTLDTLARYDRQLGAKVAPVERLGALVVRLRDAGLDAELSPDARQALKRLSFAQTFERQRTRERIDEVDRQIRALADRGEMPKGSCVFPFQRTGIVWLTGRRNALLADEQGTGKAQPESEPVLTPKGYVPIGQIRVGDPVIGANGKATRVTGVFPQGERDVYRVTLTDGSWTRCDEEHLWLVQANWHRFSRKRGYVKTLREIVDRGLRTNYGWRWFVPLAAAIEYATLADAHPLAPYALGALLANGCISHKAVGFSASPQQVDELGQWLPAKHCLKNRKGSKWDYNLVSDLRPKHNHVAQALRDLSCMGKRSWEKSIPKRYLLGSVADRRLLLAGLMDNDGTISRDGVTIEYNTSSPELASDVAELVRSLGCAAWISNKVPTYVYKGERKEGRVAYRVTMALDFNPFRIPAKAERYVPRTKYPPAHAIESVVADGREECVCIRVEAEDKLYVTRDMIVTHNTIQLITAVPPRTPVLVVVPAGLKGNWTDEVRKWRPMFKATVLEGRGSFRYPLPGEFLITNFEILPPAHDKDGVKGRACMGLLPPEPCKGCEAPRSIVPGKKRPIPGKHVPTCSGYEEPRRCMGCHPALDDCPEGVVLIVDEAHALKTSKSNRTQSYRALRRRVQDRGGWSRGGTGTPLEKHPMDLWNVFSSIGIAEEAFGSFDGFVDLFKGERVSFSRTDKDKTTYKWPKLEPEDSARIRPALERVMIRRTREDVLPWLPPVRYTVNEVDVGRRALAQCDELVRRAGGIEAIARVVEGAKDSGDEESEGDQDLGIKGLSTLRATLAVAKIPAMLKFVENMEAQDEPLVVFSPYREPIEALRNRPGWGVIIGGPKRVNESASAIAKRFQAGEFRGVGMTIAGGVGITLTRAANLLRVDRNWNPATDDQARDRLIRIGQMRAVVITDLVANHPLEARVAEIHKKKRNFVAYSVDAAKTADDSPLAKAIETEMRRVQEEAAAGGALRRAAESEDEQRAIETLRTARFTSASDENLATRLAEESAIVGLSQAQWGLARRVALRAERQPDSQMARQPDERMEKSG